MLRTLAAVAVVCLAAALIALLPSGGASAEAAAGARTAEPFPSIPLSGRTQRGSFTGRLSVSRVVARGDQIIASGSVTGRLSDRRYPSTQPVSIRRLALVLTVTATPGARDCASLSMATTSVRARVVGLPTEIAARSFVVRPRRNGPRAVADILCATSQILTAQPPAVGVPPSPVVVHLLNALRHVHS